MEPGLLTGVRWYYTHVHTHTHPGGDIVQATGDNVRQSFDTSVRPALLHPRPPSLLYLKSRQFVRTGSVAVVPAFCNLGGHPPTLLYPLLPPSGAHKVKSPSQPPILCIAVPIEKLANFEMQNHMQLHIHLLGFLMI